MISISDFMLCDILDCGYDDIKYLFDGMDRNLLSDAIDQCKDNFGELSAVGIWFSAIENAEFDIFDGTENFENNFNYLDTDIYFTGNKDDYKDFEKLCDKFEKLTGFEIIYYED